MEVIKGDCNMDLFEQVRGMVDCREGKEPQSDDPSYLNGYGIEVELQEIKSNQGEGYASKNTQQRV